DAGRGHDAAERRGERLDDVVRLGQERGYLLAGHLGDVLDQAAVGVPGEGDEELSAGSRQGHEAVAPGVGLRYRAGDVEVELGEVGRRQVGATRSRGVS